MSLREELARAVCAHGGDASLEHLKIHEHQAEAAMALLTREIEREREACAKIVENAKPSIQEVRDKYERLMCYADIPTWGDVAAAIRARREEAGG